MFDFERFKETKNRNWLKAQSLYNSKVTNDNLQHSLGYLLAIQKYYPQTDLKGLVNYWINLLEPVPFHRQSDYARNFHDPETFSDVPNVYCNEFGTTLLSTDQTGQKNRLAATSAQLSNTLLNYPLSINPDNHYQLPDLIKVMFTLTPVPLELRDFNNYNCLNAFIEHRFQGFTIFITKQHYSITIANKPTAQFPENTELVIHDQAATQIKSLADLTAYFKNLQTEKVEVINVF